jgi:hypothetical protein
MEEKSSHSKQASGRERWRKTSHEGGNMRGVQQGALSHSWQATKNRERRRQKRSRNFRSARSRDEFIEIPISHTVGVENAIRRQGGGGEKI